MAGSNGANGLAGPTGHTGATGATGTAATNVLFSGGSLTSSTAILTTDQHSLYFIGTAGITVTLPTAASVPGKLFYFRSLSNVSKSTGFTVHATGTINGQESGTNVINAQCGQESESFGQVTSVTLISSGQFVSDGTNWNLVNNWGTLSSSGGSGVCP
jgi:hypothetical protein